MTLSVVALDHGCDFCNSIGQAVATHFNNGALLQLHRRRSGTIDVNVSTVDGTNACVIIDSLASADDAMYKDQAVAVVQVGEFPLYVFAQSRNNLITPAKDNARFAGWVAKNAEQLVEILGKGYHFGEWCGARIQRGYGLTTKKFALFDTKRWGALAGHPDGGLLGGALTVVPVLAEGYMPDPGAVALACMEDMKANGSRFAPGFMDPEGVVMRHGPSGTVFKKTYDYDEQGKWAEKQARKNGN